MLKWNSWKFKKRAKWNEEIMQDMKEDFNKQRNSGKKYQIKMQKNEKLNKKNMMFILEFLQ
jgi:hypothetical protein